MKTKQKKGIKKARTFIKGLGILMTLMVLSYFILCFVLALIPVEKEINRPQETVTEHDYEKAVVAASTLRDKALVEVLWSCGLRRSEIARLDIADVNFSEGFLIIRTSKTGKPRIAPLSPSARHALRKHIGKRSQGSLFGMTTNAIRLCLMRLGAPSAHAWRRGWAVQALRSGVSETSVRAAAGWSSGAMVARYTRALSGELAVEEFKRGWAQIDMKNRIN